MHSSDLAQLPMIRPTNRQQAKSYKAYGFLSPTDLALNPGLIPVDFILKGFILLGEARTYAQARTLAACWRLNDRTRRTLVAIPLPQPRA